MDQTDTPLTRVFDELVQLIGKDAACTKLSLLSDIKDKAVEEIVRRGYRRQITAELIAKKPQHTLLKMAVADIGIDFFLPQDESRPGRKSQSLMKFITISAKDGIDPVSFMKQMEKCTKKTMLQAKRGYYTLEQRSEGDQDPYGWHIHWLVEFERTSANKTVIQQTAQCFQKYIAGDNYVDVKEVYNLEQFDQKLKYISGIKKNDKMPKVWKDMALKDDLAIPHLISY